MTCAFASPLSSHLSPLTSHLSPLSFPHLPRPPSCQCFEDLNCVGVLGGVPELSDVLNEDNVEYSYGKVKGTARKGALPV